MNAAAKQAVGDMAAASGKATLELRVRSVTWETDDILRYELVAPDGGALPRFSAGAHLDLHVAPGIIRQYSLCNDPAESARYVIAVLHEPDGRGGSRAVHQDLRAGSLVRVSEPRNHFPLIEAATRHVLLAGGIGVTPMMAMVARLQDLEVDWHLHYCTRSLEKTAFAAVLAPLVEQGRVTLHHDAGDPSRGLNIAATLAEREPGTHLYYCGPKGFMAAVAQAAEHWPAAAVHCEYFSAPVAEVDAGERENTAFRVRIGRTGEELEVPADRSIVDVLREHGHYVDTSCEEGYCGTCLTPYLEGDPEHRDTVLDEDDRAHYVLICCARSRTPTLVLDL